MSPPTRTYGLLVTTLPSCPLVALRSPVRLASLVLCLVFFGVATVSAQTGSLNNSPAEIVKKYFALDQKGARLDALSVEALTPYKGWDEEPVWGRVVVIRNVSVAEHYREWEVVNRLEIVIPVTFEVIGSVYMETAAFIPESTREEARVRVKSVRNRWRIVEPMLPPHVGYKRMIDFVRESLVKETEPAKRQALGELLEEVRNAK